MAKLRRCWVITQTVAMAIVVTTPGSGQDIVSVRKLAEPSAAVLTNFNNGGSLAIGSGFFVTTLGLRVPWRQRSSRRRWSPTITSSA